MTAIGDPIIRVDGRAKVTGAAKYAAEFELPHTAQAVMVTSTVANGSHSAYGCWTSRAGARVF